MNQRIFKFYMKKEEENMYKVFSIPTKKGIHPTDQKNSNDDMEKKIV